MLSILLVFSLTHSSIASNLRLFPLKRGNSAEPPGLIPIKHLIPDESSPYVLDLHPFKHAEGAKETTPCGLTPDVLNDPYGSHRLELTGDPSKEMEAPSETDCIKTDPMTKGEDKGSGLVWLLGDPAQVPKVENKPPPENPLVAQALAPTETAEAGEGSRLR